jgi:hypothetical protein
MLWEWYWLQNLSKISCIHCPYSETKYSRDAWILGTRSPRQLNFVWWHPVFVGPEYGTVFYITLLAPRMSRWLLDIQKICGPLLYSTLHATVPCISVLTSLSIIKWPPLFELLWYFCKCWHPYCILERERRIVFVLFLLPLCHSFKLLLP